MTARWIPDDAELDALARRGEPHVPSRDQAEQNRTRLLAAAASRVQQSRRSVVPYAIGGAAIAAAAALAIWIAARPGEPERAVAVVPKQVITPIGPVRYEQVSDWADFVVRLDDGKLAVQVTTLGAGERFRVKTADAEAAVTGARFEIAADQGRIASVAVQEGRVELRVIGQQVVILAAGETWVPPARTARRDEVVLPATPAPAIKPPPRKAPPKVHVETPSRAPALVETPAKPGEAEFRAGMIALRASDPRAATSSFATACTLAHGDPIAEDACFWAGAAAQRAGATATARTALAAFLRGFPGSPRAGEAAALLGWIVYEAGDLDGAERLFRQAVHDRVPQVRDSAERGLTAVERKRATSP